MADQQQAAPVISPTSSEKIDARESKIQMQSSETITSSTQLIERNVRQIQVKEESVVKKVLKTREIKHYNAAGDEILPNETHNPSTRSENDDIDRNSNQSAATNEPTKTNISSLEFNPMTIQNQESNVHQSEHRINSDIYNNHDKRVGNQNNSNYQNLTAGSNISANQVETISNEKQQRSNSSNFVQPINRTTTNTNKITGVQPTSSRYEEQVDSAGPMDYNNDQQKSIRVMVNDSNSSNYGGKGIIHVQPLPAINPSSIMVHHDNIPQNGIGYVNQKSNYDLVYETATAQATSSPQVPIKTNSAIYGTQSIPDPIYAINRNGNLTYLPVQPQPQPETSNGVSEMRWRNPELEEVVSFLSSPDPMIRANSVAYLQHLCFADDLIKQKTRSLGAIPILIELLNRDMLDVQRNVCGALRNLSYGRKNDDNKRAIRDALGIQSLIRTLVNNPDNEIRELATSVLWNLSSCEDVKWSIVEDAVGAIVSVILVPYTAWFRANFGSAQQFLPSATETHWSTVFRNATGIIRNISSAGANARRQLRDCEGLIESLFFIINTSISRNDVENKLVENCVCILRNLSYRCQETQDPDYDKHFYNNNSQSDSTNSMQNSPSSPSSSANLTTSLVNQVSSRVTENLGCFSFARRKSKSKSSFSSSSRNATMSSNQSSNNMSAGSATLLPPHHPSNLQANSQNSTLVRTSTQLDGFNSSNATLPRSGISGISNNYNDGSINSPTPAKDLLWQPSVVKPYLALLSGCSNSETLEAAAGSIQNLAACYWQPSVDIRATVRKERGLPVLVELLRMDRDRVVCVVATALRNLAIDHKNKELIGKYAMPDLVNKLSSGQTDNDPPASDDTIAAVLATLHEVISNNADFVRSFYESGGLNKLTYIVRNRSKYSTRVQRFAAQVLLDMWKFTELREIYKKGGWKESHFIVRQPLTSKNSTYSVNSNTIERPIASQQSDRSGSMRNLRTISDTMSPNMFQPHGNLSVTDSSQMHETHPVYGTVQMTALNGQVINNPHALYAQVDRHRKRNDLTQQTIMANNNC